MVENKVRYTEQELKDRYIGKDINQKEDYGWDIKCNTYKELGVYTDFIKLKSSLKPLLKDWKQYVNEELMNKIAVLMMDTYLIRRSRGEDVAVPQPLVQVTALQAVEGSSKPAGLPTANKADFTNWNGKIDTISDINWLYNNLLVADVKPSDAPSPGVWAHLQYHRSSPEAMTEFFTKVYPRLIPAKSAMEKMAEKLHDDGRTTFDLLERLLKEDEGSAGEVPVLPLVLPERAGLQDAQGQSAVSQEGT